MDRKMDVELKRKEIQALGLQALEDFFGVDISKISKQEIGHLHEKARIAMSFEKQMNLTQRAVEMNYLHVFKIVSEDKKEFKRLIKKSMPQYLQ